MTNVRERKWLHAAASVILSVMVALSMIPLTAMTAQADTKPYKDVNYLGIIFDLYDDNNDGSGVGVGSVAVKGCSPGLTEFIIPTTVINEGVTFTANPSDFYIEEQSFDDNADLLKAAIPTGISRIGARAFHSCTNMTEISIGAGPGSPYSQYIEIGENAFMNCGFLSTYNLDSSGLDAAYLEIINNDELSDDEKEYQINHLKDQIKNSGIGLFFDETPIGGVNVWTQEYIAGTDVHSIVWQAITELNANRPEDEKITLNPHDDPYSRCTVTPHDHNLVSIPAVPATCTKAGATEGKKCSICGAIIVSPQVVNALGHKWDGGKVTKKATTTATGVKTYTCERCKATKTETIPMLPETPYSKGATEEQVDKAITSITNDKDPKGTTFCILQLRVKATTKKSISLQWAGVKGAKKYIVYGNHCNKGSKKYKFVKLKVTKGKSVKFTKIAKKKVTKATFYKFIVVALDKNNKVIATSKSVHIPTKGGKKLTYKKVTVSKKTLKKAKALKKGKTLKIKATAVKENKKVKAKPHRPLAYESSNPSIATVTSKGVIKGKKKGSCTVYVYAQNGVFAKIPVKVK